MHIAQDVCIGSRPELTAKRQFASKCKRQTDLKIVVLYKGLNFGGFFVCLFCIHQHGFNVLLLNYGMIWRHPE